MTANKIIPCLFLFLSSCVTTVVEKKDPRQPEQSIVSLYNDAQIQYDKKNYSSALNKFLTVTEKSPDSTLTDDSYIYIGHIYSFYKKYDNAFKYYYQVHKLTIKSPRESEALYLAALSLFRLGKLEEVPLLTKKALNNKEIDDTLSTKIYQLQFNALNKLGLPLETLESLVNLIAQESDPQKTNSYRVQAIEIIERQLSMEQLQTVSSSSRFGFFRGHAYFELGKRHYMNRNYNDAISFLKNVGYYLPESNLSLKADSLLNQIQSLKKTNPYTIGVILPLSGPHSRIAYQALHGIQLGLGLYGKPSSTDFSLAIIDSQGNPDVAQKAVETLVLEHNVSAIIGPLLSKTAPAVAQKSYELGVPSICLAQKSLITQTGSTVFQYSLTSRIQVEFLADLAINQLGLKSFAILYPNDLYGIEYANSFWDVVKEKGGTIRAVQTYDPKESDFKIHIQRLVGTYFIEDRLAEYKWRFNQWLNKQSTRSLRHQIPEDLLPPVIDFDALFIPDGAQAFGQIAPMLKYNDVHDLTLLGTNLINTPEIINRAGDYIDRALFVDAQDLKHFKHNSFFVDYSATFKETPSPFSVQGYDSALLLRQLILSGVKERNELEIALSKTKTFHGAAGLLTMTSNRELVRPLIAYQIKDKIIQALDPTEVKKP